MAGGLGGEELSQLGVRQIYGNQIRLRLWQLCNSRVAIADSLVGWCSAIFSVSCAVTD